MANYACVITDQFIYAIYPEIAKAGGSGGARSPSLGGVWGIPSSRYFCLSVPWFVTGPLRAG